MAENSVEKNMTDLTDENAADIFQEGSFEMKTQAQIPVISKTARIVEEVVITKQMIERAATVRDSIKKTTVEVSEINTDDAINRRNG